MGIRLHGLHWSRTLTFITPMNVHRCDESETP
jgi:hypothetical protein